VFGLFTHSQGSDPLASRKNVSRWLEELPAGDIYAAQRAVVDKLVEFNQSELDFSKEHLAVLRRLDEGAREMQASLCAQYLANPRLGRASEARLWTVIQAFYYELATAYHAFVMHRVANPGMRGLHAQAHFITGRALRAMAEVMKWRYFHFERIDEKLWLRMHNLYHMAELEGFAGHPLRLYDADPEPSSCQREYLHALLLSPFGYGNLAPRQLDTIDRWLVQWTELSQLDTRFDPDRHCFYVDTSRGTGLRRIRNPGDHPAWRYLSATPLRSKLGEIRAELIAGTSPASLGLGEDFRPMEGYDLLDFVRDEWTPLAERDRRGEPRRPKQDRWEIVRDLEHIFIAIRPPQEPGAAAMSPALTPEEILDIKLYGFVTERARAATVGPANPADQRGHWLQINESGQGIGFATIGEGLDGTLAGRLLALRREGSTEPWQLAVVRRVMLNQQGERAIGVQLLNGRLEGIDLEQEALLPDQELARQGYEVHDLMHSTGQVGQALLLTDAQGGRAIVLDRGRYNRGRQYLIRLPDATTELVQLEAVLDKGEGWLKCAYKVLATG
jgi:hypothetical protein